VHVTLLIGRIYFLTKADRPHFSPKKKKRKRKENTTNATANIAKINTWSLDLDSRLGLDSRLALDSRLDLDSCLDLENAATEIIDRNNEALSLP
jgi:hypothetical protein